MPAPRPVLPASSPPRKANCRPGRYDLDAPPERPEAATADEEAYVNGERLRARLREMNP